MVKGSSKKNKNIKKVKKKKKKTVAKKRAQKPIKKNKERIKKMSTETIKAGKSPLLDTSHLKVAFPFKKNFKDFVTVVEITILTVDCFPSVFDSYILSGINRICTAPPTFSGW